MPKATHKLKFERLPTGYPALVAFHPPRPIHDRIDYDNTMEIVLALAGHSLSIDQEDYLKVLSEMILQYEREHDQSHKRGTPLQRLNFLVEQAGLSASDLGRLLGNRGMGSLLLTGKRSLSKVHIRKLAEHFKVRADYFF